MRIVPVLPPDEDVEVFKAELIRVLGVAKHLNITLDPQGFAIAFQSDNMRLFIATDTVNGDEHHVVGMSMMAFGTKFFDENISATVMFAEGPARNALLAYMRDTCQVLKCRNFFYEAREGDTLGGDETMLRHVKTY